jgi:hypothetical protein
MRPILGLHLLAADRALDEPVEAERLPRAGERLVERGLPPDPLKRLR